MYAKLKGNHNFVIDMATPKAFITDLPIGEYVDLQRRPMLWKNTADEPSISVSSLMSVNRFVEILQNLYLVDTSTLAPKNKFTKVRLLIEKLDKQCFLLYLLEQTISTDESIVP